MQCLWNLYKVCMYMCSAVLMLMNIPSFQRKISREREKEQMNCCWQNANWKLRLFLAHCTDCRILTHDSFTIWYNLWNNPVELYLLNMVPSIDIFELWLLFCLLLNMKFRLKTLFLLEAGTSMAYRLIFCVFSVAYPMLWLPYLRSENSGRYLVCVFFFSEREKNKIPNEWR